MSFIEAVVRYQDATRSRQLVGGKETSPSLLGLSMVVVFQVAPLSTIHVFPSRMAPKSFQLAHFTSTFSRPNSSLKAFASLVEATSKLELGINRPRERWGGSEMAPIAS